MINIKDNRATVDHSKVQQQEDRNLRVGISASALRATFTAGKNAETGAKCPHTRNGTFTSSLHFKAWWNGYYSSHSE